MRRELYFFTAALLYVSGNLTAGYVFTCIHESIRTAAVIFMASTVDIALIFLIRKKIPWII